MARSRHEQPRHWPASDDPLAAALLPPANESPIQKQSRIERENEARRVSEAIDEMIRQERSLKKKMKPDINILLLGQSESGKSTTLKQFQLVHNRARFSAERMAWRAVIYLNLVRSITRILDALSPESDIVDDHDDNESLETASIIITSTGRPPDAISGTRVPNYESYRSRLAPLTGLGEHLTRLLSSSADDEPTRLSPLSNHGYGYSNANLHGYPDPYVGTSSRARPAPTIRIPQNSSFSASPISPMNGHGSAFGYQTPSNSSTSSRSAGGEVSVHASHTWKQALGIGGRSKSPKISGEIEGWWEDPDDPVHAIHALGPVMQELWADSRVRRRLSEKRIRLEESSGFYLNDIPRITAMKYFPTDEDVLKARLKTTGVVEHSFSVQSGTGQGAEWRIYDVGGARNQRAAWAPYFEDVNAIIFLAPISAFDQVQLDPIFQNYLVTYMSVFHPHQVLTEDPRVNRLEDSLMLWRSVVSNKLLANVSIVLFLNKIDLLQAKLEAGVRLSRHMINYGDRPNDYDTVSKYFKHKFVALHQRYTPNREREIYVHLTAVTDARRTERIITTVRDIIIKVNLRNMKLV